MWMIAIGMVRTMTGVSIVRTMIAVSIVRTMIAVSVRTMIAIVTAVTAIICAPIHSAINPRDAERREGSPNSSLGGVKRPA
jgi:hypothetical protein